MFLKPAADISKSQDTKQCPLSWQEALTPYLGTYPTTVESISLFESHLSYWPTPQIPRSRVYEGSFHGQFI